VQEVNAGTLPLAAKLCPLHVPQLFGIVSARRLSVEHAAQAILAPGAQTEVL